MRLVRFPLVASFLVSSIAACSGSHNGDGARVPSLSAGTSNEVCPPGEVFFRDRCRPQRGIIIDQRPKPLEQLGIIIDQEKDKKRPPPPPPPPQADESEEPSEE